MSPSPNRPRSASEALTALTKGEEIELENKVVTPFLDAIKKHQPDLKLQTFPDKKNSGWTVIAKEQPVETKKPVSRQSQEPFMAPDPTMFERFAIQQKIRGLVELYVKRNLLDRKEKADFRFLSAGIQKSPETKKYNVEGVPVWIKITRTIGITVEYSDKLLE